MPTPPPRPEIGDLRLADLISYVVEGLGGPSHDRLADATKDPRTGERAIAPNSLTNMANPDRPVLRAPEVRNLIGAAAALQHRVTPWVLYVAAGISMEPLGLTGRPTAPDVAALPMLPDGWSRMEAADFSVWVAVGRALIAARAAQDQSDEIADLRAEVDRLRAELDDVPQRRRRAKPVDQ